MRVAGAAAALGAALAVAGPAAAQPLVAERIAEGNVAERQIGGPDAIGGLGDWYLANDLVEFIVDDPGRRHAKLNHGGTLVDAGLRGREGDDQFARLFPLLNLDQRVVIGYDGIRSEVDPAGRFARLVVSSSGLDAIGRGGALARTFDFLVPEAEAVAGVVAETEYRVEPGEPFVHITTRLHNRGEDAAPIFSYGDVWMRGGRGMRSFVANTLSPGASPGFHHRSFDRANILESSGEAMGAFTFVAMSGVPGFPAITYAIFSPERTGSGLRSFGVTGKHVNLVNAFTFDPPWEELGLWRLLRATLHELEPGEKWSTSRRLLVVDGAGVARATNRILPILGLADGKSGIEVRVDPPGVRASLLVERAADGAPVTELDASRDENGAARARLPPGVYRVTLRAAHRAPRTADVRVAAGRFAVAEFALPEPGRLRFGPAFADGGPGRVIVEGMGDTPDPVFQPELLDFRLDGRGVGSGTETPDLLFVGGDADPELVEIAPGRYRLTGTRGLTHTLAQVEVEVPADGGEALVPPLELRQVIALEGVASADLHVHAQASDDSQTRNEHRLRAFVAEGVDLLVSTDHDHVGNFAPALASTGLDRRIRVRTGVEVTSSTPSRTTPWTLGHHNAWPVAYRPHAHRHGAPPSQELRAAELYALLRSDYGVRVVQLNHALNGDGEMEDGNYLSHLGVAGESFDPDLPVSELPNRRLLDRASDRQTRAIDFDAMEVMNGRSFAQYRTLREAWYSLLRQGFLRTATGNSDTHGPDEEAGYPRNYVYLGEDEWDDASFDAAVRAGRSFVTTGPLIAAFRANDGRIGDLVPAPGGEVTVRVAVAAPPWVPVDEVRLLLNGEVLRRWTQLEPPDALVRLSREESLQLDADGFLTVEAGAPLEVDSGAWRRERGGVYAATVARGFVSQALSNPIRVDVDGDGRFTAPGLPGQANGGAVGRLASMAGLIGVLALLWFLVRRRVGLGGTRPGP